MMLVMMKAHGLSVDIWFEHIHTAEEVEKMAQLRVPFAHQQTMIDPEDSLQLPLRR